MTHHQEDYLPAALQKLSENPRITVRRPGIPAKDGKCIVYWMQRAQRALDNPALDIAIEVANELNLPVIVYFSAISNFPSANLRHYYFLNQGLRDIETDLAERGIAFIVRRPPHNSLEALLAEVGAAMVIGDENPCREPERWRRVLANRLKIPFWTSTPTCSCRQTSSTSTSSRSTTFGRGSTHIFLSTSSPRQS